MPASSTSTSLGWAAYIAASFALCFALAPSLSTLYNGARTGGAVRTVDGIAAIIDELRPGVTVSFSYASPGSSGQVLLGGYSVSISDGNGTARTPVHWLLPIMTLVPGVTYTAVLLGDSVEVTSAGGG